MSCTVPTHQADGRPGVRALGIKMLCCCDIALNAQKKSSICKKR